MLITTDAFVLFGRKFRDTSKIISFYTADDGMITCIAKGARLPKNKFGSSLEPLSLSLITYYKKSTRDIYLLSKSETLTSFKNIMNSYDKLNIGLAILESISQTQLNYEPNPAIFNLLKQSLQMLDSSKANYYNYFYKFQLELYKIIGYSISFSYFDLNEITKTNKFGFELESGEFVGKTNNPRHFGLNRDSADYLKRIDESAFEILYSIDVNYRSIKSINAMLMKYLSYHLDKGISFKTLSNYLITNI